VTIDLLFRGISKFKSSARVLFFSCVQCKFGSVNVQTSPFQGLQQVCRKWEGIMTATERQTLLINDS